MSSYAHTCAEEIRATMADLRRLAPNDRDPQAFTAAKSEIGYRLGQIADMLEGNFSIVAPEPKPTKDGPATKAKRPTAIVDRNGNVIRVDFKNRRRIEPPKAR